MSEAARNGGLATAPAPAGGALTATRDAPLGGQAVLEGVMMRGVKHWAVAFRKPGLDEDTLGEIGVETFELPSSARRTRVYKLPLVRGVVALGGSMKIGLQALGISANAQLAAEEALAGPQPSDAPAGAASAAGDGAGADRAAVAAGDAVGTEADAKFLSGGVWAGTVLISVVFAIGLFFVVPVTITSLIKHQLGSSLLFWLVEGLVRTVIFLGYLLVLSRISTLRRVFEYHGAEHKVISCYEAEDELTPERAKLYSRFHPRCGTSFLLIVMVVSIFIFAPLGLPSWWILVLTRILGVPVIAGLSFELIKWAGRNRRHRWVQIIIAPGMQLQKLTTAEPDLDQLAVAIAGLQAVLTRETPGSLTAEDLLGVEVVA